MSTETHAARILANLANRPHPSTHRQILQELRDSFPCQDDGLTETFTLSDSRIRYDHTANPGFRWSEV